MEDNAVTNELIRGLQAHPHAPGNPVLAKRAKLFMFAAFFIVSGVDFAQEPVVGVADPESLFTDANPKLNTNKQATLRIMKDLLRCNHWDEADKWLTAR